MKELLHAIREFENRRFREISLCREAAELAYWFYRTLDLNARLSMHFELFLQFHDYVAKCLHEAVATAPDCLSDQNIERALVTIARVRQPALRTPP